MSQALRSHPARAIWNRLPARGILNIKVDSIGDLVRSGLSAGMIHPPRPCVPPARLGRSGQRGGIMDLWTAKAACFKYGSGIGDKHF